jgi:MoaA/NifB/PqqE/SkfB family radical SAM enzyme
LRKICFFPWKVLLLNHDEQGTTFTPCLYLSNIFRFKGNINSAEDVMEAWNSPELQTLRHQLVTGNLNPICSRCEECTYSHHHDIFGCTDYLPKYSLNESESYNKLFAYCDGEYKAGRTTLSQYPLEIYAQCSLNCNYRCKMCVSGEKRTCDTNLFPVEGLKKAVRGIGWDNIDRFGFIGGETFFALDTRDLVDFSAEAGSTCLFLTTNGSLIDKNLDKLDKLHNLYLTVSVDGFKEHYNQIRVNGDWIKLIENLDLIKEMRKHHPEWRVNFNSIIMKTSYTDIVSLIYMAQEYNATIFFSRIAGGNPEEDFHRYPNIIDKTDLYKHIEQGLELARELDMYKTEDSLVNQYNEFGWWY